MSEINTKELTEDEKKLYQAIEKDDNVTLKTILSQIKNVNIVDTNSMSPLQYAAYKGNKEIVQILLDQVKYFLFYMVGKFLIKMKKGTNRIFYLFVIF